MIIQKPPVKLEPSPAVALWGVMINSGQRRRSSSCSFWTASRRSGQCAKWIRPCGKGECSSRWGCRVCSVFPVHRALCRSGRTFCLSLNRCDRVRVFLFALKSTHHKRNNVCLQSSRFLYKSVQWHCFRYMAYDHLSKNFQHPILCYY